MNYDELILKLYKQTLHIADANNWTLIGWNRPHMKAHQQQQFFPLYNPIQTSRVKIWGKQVPQYPQEKAKKPQR